MNFVKNSIKLPVVKGVFTKVPVGYESLASIMKEVAKEHGADLKIESYVTLTIEKDGKEILDVPNFLENGSTSHIYYSCRDKDSRTDLEDSIRARFAYLLKTKHGETMSGGED